MARTALTFDSRSTHGLYAARIYVCTQVHEGWLQAVSIHAGHGKLCMAYV